MEILKQIAEHLEAGEDERVGELTRAAIADKLPSKQILDEGLLAGMTAIGKRFREHEIFLPDVLLAARAMYAGLDELKPLLLEEGVPGRGKVIIGTVRGDIHDIGKNLVGIMLRGAGYEVIDLGSDVPPEKFVDAARETGAKIVGMSTLLTTTMPVMAEVVELLGGEGMRDGLKVIIGGAPVNKDFADSIGADEYGYDGASAVDKIEGLFAVLGEGE
jgi:5-methyltetrahydrofolate--homocysteine methyltransferase